MIAASRELGLEPQPDKLPAWLKSLEESPITTPETQAQPEFPGAPFEDEMFGNLILGETYPRLNMRLRELDQIGKPEETFAERQKISNQISQLIVEASDKNAWHYGPVNIRKPKPQPQDLPHVPPFVGDDEPSDEIPPTDNDNDEPIPLPPRQPQEKGNWLTKRIRRAFNGLKGEVKDFSEYTDRHRDESKLLAVLGGLAGGASAGFGYYAATAALAAAFPPLAAGITGAAIGLSINYGFMRLYDKLYVKRKRRQDWFAYDKRKHGSMEEYIKKIRLDEKGRIRAFAIADVVGKIAGGIGLSSAFADRVADQPLTHDGGNPAASYQAHGDRVDIPHNTTQVPDTASPVIPDQPHATVDVTPDVAKDVLTTPFTEHVVSGNSEMLTKIMESSLPAGENVYSDNYIKVLEMNRDTFVQMWREMYPSGNVPYLVDSATNDVTHLTLNQAIDNLDKVIARGYPNPAQLTGAEYRQALTDMFNAVRHLKPGTVIKIPTT